MRYLVRGWLLIVLWVLAGCSGQHGLPEQPLLPTFEEGAFRKLEFELVGATKAGAKYECRPGQELTVRAQFVCSDGQLAENGSIQFLKEKDATHRIIVDSWSLTAESVNTSDKEVDVGILAPKLPGEYTLLIEFVRGLVLCRAIVTVSEGTL